MLLAVAGEQYWEQLMFQIVLGFVAFLLIVVVLVQRGRGGGLTGALGGMGGQSAFGAKAGDLFTRITIVLAAVWIVLSMVAVRRMGSASELKIGGGTGLVVPPPGDAGTTPDGLSSPDGLSPPVDPLKPKPPVDGGTTPDKPGPAPEPEDRPPMPPDPSLGPAAPKEGSVPAEGTPAEPTPPAPENSSKEGDSTKKEGDENPAPSP